MRWIRISADSRAFGNLSASGCFDYENTPQAWMTVCPSVPEHRLVMIVFVTVQSNFSIAVSLVPLGLAVSHAFKVVLPEENFVSYISLRRCRRY